MNTISRVTNAASTAKLRMKDAFKNESGAFDLPSIIVGVVVVGILTAGVLAAIFGVIPFAQDKAAEQDLGSVTTAQGVAKAQFEGYMDLSGLQDEKLLSSDLDVLEVDTQIDGDGWVAASLSGSGKVYVSTDEDPKPKIGTGSDTVAAAITAATAVTP